MFAFEINLLLLDHIAKEVKDVRQYFQQDQGCFQAIQDTLAWVHLRMQKIKDKHPNSNFVVERLAIWKWNIAVPLESGEIKTYKFQNCVLNWSFEKGLIEIEQGIANKQRKRAESAVHSLKKYRHTRAEIQIEQISGEIMEDVTYVAL